MQLFYFENPRDEFTLSKEESNHVIKVLRKKKGDTLFFTDGKGNQYTVQIGSINKKSCSVVIIDKKKQDKLHKGYLHIAIAPTKNISRYEWFLEKSTELGIDEITPIICSNSERKVINHKRCNKIIISAMKQSIKYHLPKLNEITTFKQFNKKNIQQAKYIAHCHESKKLIFHELKKTNKTTILIGPEGDFSKEEVDFALNNNFKSITLGKSRLRTETAAVKSVLINNII
tara:strand:- start:3282 stop:3971 length:690 start_codon:yes stop_codon:yes gene_type:complete